MYTTWADQYNCEAVVLDDPNVDPDEVIDFAKEAGATTRMECGSDSPPDLVVQLSFEGRDFPEIYTQEALRGSLKKTTV